MSFEVKTISVFERQTKKLIRKYPSLKKELLELVETLRKEPKKGAPLGKHCYKIRIAIKSKGKGKSGAARIITHVVVKGQIVYLLSIFDKSEKESLTTKEIEELLASIN